MVRIYKDIPEGKEKFKELSQKFYDANAKVNIAFNMSYDSFIKNLKANPVFIEITESNNGKDAFSSISIDEAIILRDNLTKMIDFLAKMETNTREMTIKEIEEALGYSIKIIKED